MRFDLADTTHQVITSKTDDSARPYGIDVRGDADEDLAADGTRSRCNVRLRSALMSRHFEEFAHFIAPKISRPNRGKEDYIPPHRS